MSGARWPERAAARKFSLQAALNREDVAADEFEVVDDVFSVLEGTAREVCERALDGVLDRASAAELVARDAGRTGLADEAVPAAVCIQALRNPRLLALPPLRSITAQLDVLVALAPIEAASLWRRGPVGRIDCVAQVGGSSPTSRLRREALRVLGGGDGGRQGPRARIHAVPVPSAAGSEGVLALRIEEQSGRERALLCAEAAAAGIGHALDRERLLHSSAERERTLVESSERRLTRMGYDLHDGAIQDLAALAGDVRFFRQQLTEVLGGHDGRDIVLGRVDDLEARLHSIDEDLRELARSFETSRIVKAPLEDILQRELRAFELRSEMRTELRLEGDFGALTQSQRIALVRILQEALANVRDHSGAKEVRVSVVRQRGKVQAEIVDDGRGFRVEPTLIRAAKGGRLGLVGMGERVRLLGGSFDVESRIGGPTRISVVLPEWQPVAAGGRSEEAASQRRGSEAG